MAETGQLSPDAVPSPRHPAARRRRSDAVRNAEKVFAAALEVCASAGLAAGLPEVASRAGVGRATVYRSFASRDELIAAVMAHKLRMLAERVAVASRQDNAWEGLRDLLHGAEADRVSTACPLALAREGIAGLLGVGAHPRIGEQGALVGVPGDQPRSGAVPQPDRGDGRPSPHRDQFRWRVERGRRPA